jgi:hypothetical protein
MLKKNVEDSTRMLEELRENGLSNETYSLLEQGFRTFVDEIDKKPIVADYEIDSVEPLKLDSSNKEYTKK